jgi:hypothetical protein
MKDFIPHEPALALKELGFNEPCFGWFTNSYLRIGSVVENKHVQGEDETLAPLYQQAFRWFREKYGLHAWIINAEDNRNVFKPFFRGDNIHDQHLVDFYKTYEEAELACLNKLIEIVKTK